MATGPVTSVTTRPKSNGDPQPKKVCAGECDHYLTVELLLEVNLRSGSGDEA